MDNKNTLKNLVVGALRTHPITNAISSYSTTKYSPLPINARLMVRSLMYPEWNFTSKDFKKSEKELATDLAGLAKFRAGNRDKADYYSVERKVYKNPNAYKDDVTYTIPEWNNSKIAGRELKQYAQDLYSNGISFHDYAALDQLRNQNKNGSSSPKYSEQQIAQTGKFPDDSIEDIIVNSFKNPVYAFRTGIGRAELDNIHNPTSMKDVFDFQKINKNSFGMEDDYYNLHKFAEDFSAPIKSNMEIKGWW